MEFDKIGMYNFNHKLPKKKKKKKKKKKTTHFTSHHTDFAKTLHFLPNIFNQAKFVNMFTLVYQFVSDSKILDAEQLHFSVCYKKFTSSIQRNFL